MSVAEFLTIYRASSQWDSTMELTVRKMPSFILLAWSYSNDIEWKQQVFGVSDQWERAELSFFAEDQRVPREWVCIRAELADPLQLTNEQTDNVNTMITFSKVKTNEDRLDFDKLVTNENMQNVLDYNIPMSNVPFLKVRKNKSQKLKEGSEVATRKSKEKVQEGPKRSKEPKEAPKTKKKLLAYVQ
jgi:hypothetical protein